MRTAGDGGGCPGTRGGREKREKRDARRRRIRRGPGAARFRRVPRGLFGEQRACRLRNDRGTTARREKERLGEREGERETFVHGGVRVRVSFLVI